MASVLTSLSVPSAAVVKVAGRSSAATLASGAGSDEASPLRSDVTARSLPFWPEVSFAFHSVAPWRLAASEGATYAPSPAESMLPSICVTTVPSAVASVFATLAVAPAKV